MWRVQAIDFKGHGEPECQPVGPDVEVSTDERGDFPGLYGGFLSAAKHSEQRIDRSVPETRARLFLGAKHLVVAALTDCLEVVGQTFIEGLVSAGTSEAQEAAFLETLAASS